MDRRDSEIELGQNVVFEIKGTVTKNVAFDAGEQTKAVEGFV